MIDLHVHLDGSLTVADIRELARMSGAEIEGSDQKILKALTVPVDCRSLDQYLTCFVMPIALMQSPATIKFAMHALLMRLKASGMKYVEVRFAPQLHVVSGANQEDIVAAAVEGMAGVVDDSFAAGIILCCMRGHGNDQENMRTIDLATKYQCKGVCGVDLAGAEGLFPTENFAEVFGVAKDLGLNITVHAGEAAGVDSVADAIAMGATRIGHGVRLIDSPALMTKVQAGGIGIEMCPTSNLQTKAVTSLDTYPLRQYLERGIKVSVNTDNLTVSATNIDDEFALLRRDYNLTSAEERQLVRNAIDIAFATPDIKKWLHGLVDGDIA